MYSTPSKQGGSAAILLQSNLIRRLCMPAYLCTPACVPAYVTHTAPTYFSALTSLTAAQRILHVVLLYAVYVIFGATGGIGQDLAKRLLAANNKVVLAAHDEDKLSKLKEELGGGETKAIDVMNSEQVCVCAGQCMSSFHASAINTSKFLQAGQTLFGKDSYACIFHGMFLHGDCRSLISWKVLQKSMER